MITFSRQDFLRKLLCPLWLRPESAMWYAHMLYEAKLLLGDNFIQPSLEFGCMDGINTFILLGGEFGLSFDVYKEVQWDKEAHTRSTLKDDYFDTFSKKNLEIEQLKSPTNYFEVGLAWKKAHIQKSKRLGVFKQLTLWEPGQPLSNLNNEQFATIWAPNIYWVNNLPQVLQEFNRILQSDGRIITIAPDTILLKYMWYQYAEQTNTAWLKDLDRGRYENALKQARSLKEWDLLFIQNNLHINQHTMFIPALVGQVYDIGLRPMFPVFMNIYEKLEKYSHSDLLDVKQHWIDTILHFLAPLCDNQWMDEMSLVKLWHIFELRKK